MGFDEHAVTMFDMVKDAIAEFKSENKQKISASEHFAEKLDFFKCDLLRDTNVCRRLVQYLTNLSGLSREQKQTEAARHLASPLEFCCALSQWLRDLSIHHGFYLYVKSHKWNMPDCPDPPLKRRHSAPGRIGSAPSCFPEGLEGQDVLKKTLLQHAESMHPFNNSTARLWIRNITAWGNSVRKDAEAVYTALVELTARGLLVEDDFTDEERRIQRGGACRLKKFKKSSIADIRQNPSATAELQRLGVSLDDHFLQGTGIPIAL